MAKKEYKNPFRLKLEKEFGTKIITNELWKLGMKQARHLYSFKKNPLNQKYGSVASYLIREKIRQDQFKEASFYSRFEEAQGTELERFEIAQKEEYLNRLENFKEKYKDSKVSYKDRELTISQWLDELNKTINKDEMNEIIEIFKESSEYNKRSEDYNKNAQDEDTSNGLNR